MSRPPFKLVLFMGLFLLTWPSRLQERPKTRYIINWTVSLSSHFICTSLPMLFLLAPLVSFSGFTYTLDTLTRVNPNDTYLGSYYFWWTNLTYLPLFFFLFLLVLVYLTSSPGQHYLTVFLGGLALIFYAVELFDYLVFNALDSSVIYSYYGINTLLTNVLNRYHPLVFYLSVGLLFAILVVLLKNILQRFRRFSFLRNLHMSYNTLWVLITINLVALWMGSWWALQEGTWGGWWNWDSSEMFGLLVTFAGLSLHHTNWNVVSGHHFLAKHLVLVNFIVLSYFFIQLNFDLVSHNFGAKFFSIFNDNLFFAEALLVLIIYTSLLAYELLLWDVKSLSFKKGYQRQKTRTLFYKAFPLLIAVGWTGWSYKPLLNYFLWNFAELNVLNSELSLQPINFLALLVLFVWFVRPPSILLLTTLLLLSFSTHWIFSMLLYLSLNSRHLWLHLPLLLISSLSLVLYDLSFTCWIPLTPYELSYCSSYSSVVLPREWVLDTNLFDSVGMCLASDGSYLVMWNAFINANSAAINFFLLTFSHASFDNLYILGTLYASPTLVLELPLISTLSILFTLLVVAKQLTLFLLIPKIKT